jgi:hypothetical protein
MNRADSVDKPERTGVPGDDPRALSTFFLREHQ